MRMILLRTLSNVWETKSPFRVVHFASLTRKFFDLLLTFHSINQSLSIHEIQNLHAHTHTNSHHSIAATKIFHFHRIFDFKLVSPNSPSTIYSMLMFLMNVSVTVFLCVIFIFRENFSRLFRLKRRTWLKCSIQFDACVHRQSYRNSSAEIRCTVTKTAQQQTAEIAV